MSQVVNDNESKRDLIVIFVLDTSGSMNGEKIGVLNGAMEECVLALSSLNAREENVNIKLIILEYNTLTKWYPDMPIDVGSFIWKNLSPTGCTNFGNALEELNRRLSRTDLFRDCTYCYSPVIIIMTDGFPSDDYNEPFNRLKQNKWFTHSMRLGFAIGSDADERMITEVVGNSEGVFYTLDVNSLMQILTPRTIGTVANSLYARDITSQTD